MQSLILVQACNQAIWCIRSRSDDDCYFIFNPFHLKHSTYFTFNPFHMKPLDLDWMLWIVWLHACTKMSDCTGYVLGNLLGPIKINLCRSLWLIRTWVGKKKWSRAQLVWDLRFQVPGWSSDSRDLALVVAIQTNMVLAKLTSHQTYEQTV
jgi:hypothetical protein